MTTQLQITLPRIGQPWEDQGGIFIGICPGQNGEPDYALIAGADERTLFKDAIWHPRYVDIANANSDWDGMTNTQSMAEAASELAGAILDLEIDGHHDFYLPARHELRMVKLAAPELIVDDWHWSSTQSSANDAWCQDFDDGYQSITGKGLKLRARAVRRFVIHSTI